VQYSDHNQDMAHSSDVRLRYLREPGVVAVKWFAVDMHILVHAGGFRLFKTTSRHVSANVMGLSPCGGHVVHRNASFQTAPLLIAVMFQVAPPVRAAYCP